MTSSCGNWAHGMATTAPTPETSLAMTKVVRSPISAYTGPTSALVPIAG